MSRTLGSILLKRAFAKSLPSEFSESRRRFLRSGLLAGAALALPLESCVRTSAKPVAIIGGGISGLTLAYELQKKGVDAMVYEAQGRVGGRILTIDDAVVDGAYVDFGAEYIDSTHEDLLQLSKELEVPLTDLQKDSLASHCYFFHDRKITEEELVSALQPFIPRLTKDIDSIPDEPHYSKADQYRALDQQSVTDYLRTIGVTGWLFDFFDSVITGEYGMEASQQSALNLIYILALPIKIGAPYHPLGVEHEVFKFKGGSQRIIDQLSKRVEKNIQLGCLLKRITKESNGYTLTFERDGKVMTVEADRVAFTVPFTVLRGIEMNFKFPERKQKCIDTLGFGIAAKTVMGFKKRTWREQGYQGYTYTDVNRTTLWDSSQGVDLESGSLSFVTGGKESLEFQELDYKAIKERWLAGAEKIYPGLSDQYNGRIAKFCWAANPFSHGSYTSYTVGQSSEFAGVEIEPYEHIFFAGEHCSVLHQGFMNGAVESARTTAALIINSLKH